MVPTDVDLNRASALLCGWQERGDYGLDWWHNYWLSPADAGVDGEDDRIGATRHNEPPQYCSDRNAVPELLAAVYAAGQDANYAFGKHLCGWQGDAYRAFEIALTILRVEPRAQVEAALKACGLWQADWE